MGSTWPSLVALVLIVGALPLAAWLVRRAPAATGARGTALGVAAAVSVGARERIALVRADRKWLVVGITAQSITMLAELDEAPAGIDPDTVSLAGGGFADVLRSISHRATRSR
ncbi:MAG: flagellar biosynthetic protein FliO [Burkholderiaceae bacterium]|nr:flagellar biosynthetic protein FliO [Burkholderiaceae bacterium]